MRTTDQLYCHACKVNTVVIEYDRAWTKGEKAK